MTLEEIKTIHGVTSIKDCIDFYMLNDNIKIGKDNKNFSILVELLEKNGEIIEKDYFAQKVNNFEERIDEYMNMRAKKKGYEDIKTACTYAIARGRFQAEGIKFAEWRTDVWDYFYTELDKIQQGLRQEPTINEFILELPQLNLP